MSAKGISGWVVTTHALMSDPYGYDYTPIVSQGHEVLARLNWGYQSDGDYPGTIPERYMYEGFSKAVGEWVEKSNGCHKWIVGNEVNLPIEWPRRQLITPWDYAECFRACREEIRGVKGHEEDHAIPAAVGPWNDQAKYEQNPLGDWILYFIQMLTAIRELDGIAVHAYTHGPEVYKIYNSFPMDPPFSNYQYNFRTYQDFLWAVPESMRKLPVYITETDQNDTWVDANNSWVQYAYGEINNWNTAPGKRQKVHCLVLYRWRNYDKYGIEGKRGVIEDFEEAMEERYETPSDLPNNLPGCLGVVRGV